jgi:NAD(P)H-dependent flavin oxidoreductase YrpB (nitropropane dioxygenase family)
MKTAACEALGIEVPIIQAPMQGVVGPPLVAAVSNAGGLGMLVPWAGDAAALRRDLREIRALTSKPFGVNLNLSFPIDKLLDLCLDEGVPIISIFWGDPTAATARAKAGGAVVMHTVATAEDAKQAVDCGVDMVVAQGWEAGGHVRGTVTTMALVPAVVDAVAPVPVIAAGGIADGRGLAAALALGASAAWIGTRFLASDEAPIHGDYLDRIIAAGADDTVYSQDLFDIGWTDAPHRVLHNSTVAQWQAAGCPPPGARPGEGEVIVTSDSLGPVVRYQSDTPPSDGAGEIDAMALWAGQGVGLVKARQPAGDIVREINDQAEAVFRNVTSAAG